MTVFHTSNEPKAGCVHRFIVYLVFGGKIARPFITFRKKNNASRGNIVTSQKAQCWERKPSPCSMTWKLWWLPTVGRAENLYPSLSFIFNQSLIKWCPPFVLRTFPFLAFILNVCISNVYTPIHSAENLWLLICPSLWISSLTSISAFEGMCL